MARFDQTSNIRTSDLSSGASSGLMGLASQFGRFSEEAAMSRRAKVVEESERAGREAYKKGEKPEFKEETFFGGVAKKAFNQGLKSAYVAGISNDNRERLAEIEREFQDDPLGYQNAIQAHRDALEQEVDPLVRPDVLETFDAYSTTGLINVKDRAFVKQRKDAIATAQENIDSLSSEAATMNRNGDVRGSALRLQELRGHIDQAVESEFLSSEDGDNLYRSAVREATEQGKRREYDLLAESEGFDAAFRKLDEESKRVPGGWDVDEWDAYISSQQADLNAKRARIDRESKISEKEAKRLKDFADIEQRLSGDESVVINENAWNDYYIERVVPIANQLPKQERDAFLTNVVDATKVIPSALRQQTSSYIRSGNPDLMADAVSLADRLDDVPGAGEIVSPNERSFAELAVNLSKNMDTKEAIDLARKATDPTNKQRIESVKEQLKKEPWFKSKREAYQEKAVDTLSSFWGLSTPDIDDITKGQMGKEYGDMYESYRLAGSDHDQAVKNAQGVIKRNWGEWKGRTMKYPPSTFYAIDGDSEYVMGQLLSEINDNNIFPSNVTEDRVILVSTDDTARTAALGRPAYQVAIIMDDGTLQPLNDRPWYPDQQAEIERRKNESISEMNKRREKAMQKSVDRRGR